MLKPPTLWFTAKVLLLVWLASIHNWGQFIFWSGWLVLDIVVWYRKRRSVQT